MKLKVAFREFEAPYTDPTDGEQERGDYLGSFSEEIEGNSVAEILDVANRKATEYSARDGTDVRVWETEVVVTPPGIASL